MALKIYLIRHGESIMNTRENYVAKIPDHIIYLTDKGKQQAEDTGVFLKKFVEENNIDLNRAKLWFSPYKRTRETATIINRHLNIKKTQEEVVLIEQQYGLFSNTPFDECKQKFPDEFAHYEKCLHTQGQFYAKFPQGESPLDIVIRLKHFVENIFRNYEKGEDTVFVVTHGEVIKSFLLNWFHFSPEWYAAEKVPLNCSVIEIIRDENCSSYTTIYGQQ